jgi:hypothetical protein
MHLQRYFDSLRQNRNIFRIVEALDTPVNFIPRERSVAWSIEFNANLDYFSAT